MSYFDIYTVNVVLERQIFKVLHQRTRLNILFIPTLPVKAEFTAMLSMLNNAVNAEQC